MKLARQQRGMTFTSWVFVLAVLGVVVMFLLRVVPAYLENMSVRSTLDSLKADGETYTSPGEIRASVVRRLSVNNVSNVHGEDIDITLDRGIYDVAISYEVRTPFMFNIDLMLSFDHNVEVPAR